MKKSLVLLLFIFASIAVRATDNNGLVMESVDPHADSVAIAKMRARMAVIRKKRPTVAVVFSGGGAKGASHIGVLKFLEEKGVPIDLIGGTSMGGLVGGLYSSGNDVESLEKLFKEADWSVVMSDKTPIDYYSFEKREKKDMYLLSLPFEFKSERYKSFKSSLPDGGLYGYNIYNIINSITVNYQDSMDFADLPIPFYCVATEVNTNKEKNIYSGYLPEAIRSTIAIPMVFKPVRKEGDVLLDGGMKNNFPVDIARAMGADIIIGIDLHTPDDPNDHIANIMINMLFGIGNYSYNINKDASDIYIKPNMEGFWTMSFGKEEIDEIIKRGYEAAKQQEEAIDKIVALTGVNKAPVEKKRPIDLTKQKIHISSFGFEGLSESDVRFFLDKIRFVDGEEYSAKDFEMAVAEIFSTGAFSSVRYRICGDTDPYSVVFECQEGPDHTFDVSLRLDTEQIIAAIANFGLGKNRVSGFEMDATVRLSSCPSLDLDFGWVPIVGPRIGARLSTCFTNVMNFQNFDTDLTAFNFWHSYGQFYVGDSRWSKIKLQGGVRADYTRQMVFDLDNACFTAFADFKLNSLDDTYFPTRGVRFMAGAEFMFANYKGKAWNTSHSLYSQILLEVPITFCDRFTTIARLSASDISGDSRRSIYRNNTIGGMIQSRYFERQLPLSSMNGVMICKEKLTAAELNFRVRVGKKNYVSAIGDVFADGPKWNEIGRPYWGVGLQYSRSTRFGGLFANAHWNSCLNGFGVYAGIGKSF